MLRVLLIIFISSCLCQDEPSVSVNVAISQDKTISYVRSAVGLRDLVSADSEIAKILLQNVHKLHSNSYIQKASEIYLEDFYNGNGIHTPHNYTESHINPYMVSIIAKNPIGTYRTIRRLVTLLPDLMHHAKEAGILDISDKEVSWFLRRGLPDQTDLNDAMNVILSTGDMYMLNIKLFASGNISGLITGAKLDAVHCYEIGVYGSNSGEFNSQAVDWLELALNSVTIDGDRTIDKGMVSTAFHKAVRKHDEEFVDDENDVGSMSFTEKIEFMMETQNFSNRLTKKLWGYNMYIKRGDTNNPRYSYMSLCNGRNFEPPESQSKLFCWLESQVHERFLIGPLKMEFLSQNPDIVLIYDILSEKVIEKIKSVADTQMVPAFVWNKSDLKEDLMKSNVRNYRSSETAWLPDREGEFNHLAQLISHVTGLETDTSGFSELLQVGSYAPAGHFIPHVDSKLPLENQNGAGDRIATFMIYMSDVELGGNTAFPNLGVAAKPVKGSAIFWYNILRSEESDSSLLHGGCPVAIGQKYIATKWIGYRDQFLTHKCSLNRQDRYQVAVNKYIKLSKTVGKPQL